jgi:hypothetical protein
LDEPTFAFAIGRRGDIGAFTGCHSCFADLGRATWPGLLKREVISSTNIERAPPLSIPIWHASRIKPASAEPQYNLAMLSVRFKAAFCRAVE